MPGAIEATVRNLRDIAPTIYFNVPKGFEMLLPHLSEDRALRETFFSRLKADVLRRRRPVAACARRAAGARGRDRRRAHHVPDQPRLDRDRAAALACSWECEHVGNIGLPLPGLELKLVPQRRQARDAASRAQHHARLLARAGAHRSGLRRGRLLQARRRAEIRRPRRSGQGPAVRRPHRRGFQARDRHLGQRRTAAHGVHRALRAAGARRRVGRPGPRRCRRVDHSRHRRLPQACARPAAQRSPRPPCWPTRGCDGVRSGLLDALSDPSRGTSARDRPRHSAGRPAVARRRRSHRQRIDQPARGAGPSRGLGRRTLRRPAIGHTSFASQAARSRIPTAQAS